MRPNKFRQIGPNTLCGSLQMKANGFRKENFIVLGPEGFGKTFRSASQVCEGKNSILFLVKMTIE